MLTRGSFAIYYGGQDILPLLSDKTGSLVSPVFMGCSMMFQCAFLIFKKFKLRKLSPKTISSDMYASHLSSTILNGFSNTHSLVVLVIFSAAGFIFTLVLYARTETRR